MIDNYDSFTFNIVQYLQQIGQEVLVYKNDQISIGQIKKLQPQAVVISPGPGTPLESGISLQVIRELNSILPILGICLGHQCIGHVFGGTVGKAAEVVHGKTSKVRHDGLGVYSGLPDDYLVATRYHSLIIHKDSVPDTLTITAWTETESGEIDEIMGVRHKSLPIEGVQFHPESILSQYGHDLLKNFISSYC